MFAGDRWPASAPTSCSSSGWCTALLAALGMLASHRPRVQASWAVVVSAGTLLCRAGTARREGPRERPVLSRPVHHRALLRCSCSVDIVERWRAGATVVDEAPFLNADAGESRRSTWTTRRRRWSRALSRVDRPARPSPSSPARLLIAGSSAAAHLPRQGSPCCRRRSAPGTHGAAASANASWLFTAALLTSRPAGPHRADADRHPDLLVRGAARAAPASARRRRSRSRALLALTAAPDGRRRADDGGHRRRCALALRPAPRTSTRCSGAPVTPAARLARPEEAR